MEFGFGRYPAVFPNPTEILLRPKRWPDFPIQPDLRENAVTANASQFIFLKDSSKLKETHALIE